MPVAFNAALAWLFGHTLRGGREPLVARIIASMEGQASLALPGVRRYARQVTVFWAALLGLQTLLLAAYWLGTGPMQLTPSPAMVWYAHLGGYLVPVLAMLGEYTVRRLRLRHIHHPGPAEFARNLAACWPSLVRGMWA